VTRLLVVEDEESFQRPISFTCSARRFRGGRLHDRPGRAGDFDRTGADLVLLDLMLPGCRAARSAGRCVSASSVPGDHAHRQGQRDRQGVGL